MEYNAFRDYCKAENSEDEEVNRDLQSRLYAEIYYASNDTVNEDTKTNIKLETFVDKKPYKDASTDGATGSNASFISNNTDKNYTKACPLNDTMNNAIFMETDNKPDIKSIRVAKEIESQQKDTNNKGNSSELCAKTSKHSEDNTEVLKKDKQITVCHSLDSAKSNSDCHSAHNIKKDVKPDMEIESKEKLNTKQCLNPEIIINQFPPSYNKKHNSDNNTDKNQKVTSSETSINNNYNNILKKYEFSKTFINKLYLEKYKNLQRRLEQIQEEREKKVADKHIATNVEEDKNLQQRKSDNISKPKNRVETNTKYKVLSKTDKEQKAANSMEDITVLLSDTESDSEESILEVPIPPKPQPPIINLQDSDESSEASSSDSDTDQDFSFTTEGNMIAKDPDDDISMSDTANDITITEDIVLNCTEIQKGASTIKEIMEMSRTVQSAQCSNNEASCNEKQKSVMENEVRNRDLNASDKSLPFPSDKDKTSEVHLPPKTVNITNAVYERDKNRSVSFTEDVMVSNFLNSNELTPNRKRQRENDTELGMNSTQEKDTGNESKRPKTSPGQQNKDKNNQESWEEYFFRPLSENIKAFYNEPRGQENFDVEKLQRKMSKDPRLWAILDEDLMPELLKRHRYWNVKCNNCHQHGHQKHSCPEPYKPLHCHMCGTQGHTETRCPQKMCLTCGKKQGTFRKTCESCRTLYCNMCRAIGHKSTECPDLWRRFHQTTRISEINIPDNLSEVMKPADLLYCCNCTKRGHDSSTCHEYRWSQHFPTPAFVSSYTDGPEYEVPTHGNTTEDVIPLTKPKKIKGVAFLQEADDLDDRYVIYTYGKFYTRKPNGEEITRTLAGEQIQASHLTNLLKGRVYPTFLDQLVKIVKFEIQIYYNASKELMIRVRSILDVCRRVLEIFVYWLKLDDGDKQLHIHTDLPRKTDKLIKFLTAKLEGLNKDLRDPNHLCNQIEQLKLSMANIQDPASLQSASERILDLRSKLMQVFNKKPKLSPLVGRLKQSIKGLKKSPCLDAHVAKYLNIIVIYNKIFVPRALSDVELQRFLAKYNRKANKEAKQKEKNEQKKNNEGKKQRKKKVDPYETFVQNLQKFNKSATSKTDDRNVKPCKIVSNIILQKNIEKQDKQVPTITSTTVENVSTSTSIQPDTETVTHTVEDISSETCSVQQNVDGPSNICPKESIQLPRNQDISSSNETVNTTNKTSSTVSSNSISVPLEKPAHTNVSPKPSKSEHLISDPSIQTKSIESKTEIHSKTVIDDNEIAKTSNVHETDTVDPEPSAIKKKKSKKAKKAKQDLESNSEIAESRTKNIDPSMQDKANQIINEALKFNVPYMDKAVEEIKKRINDKNLKQEHIDTLQRLINLENDHRKYVSSFCNYLQ